MNFQSIKKIKYWIQASRIETLPLSISGIILGSFYAFYNYSFDKIIFVKAKKKLRLKRFKSKNGDKKLFNLLNSKQLRDNKKIKFCDYVVVNEKNLKILKKDLSTIISKYE